MRVLVTGATGTVGRSLVAELLAREHGVRALTRSPERTALPDGVEVVAGDLTDPASLGDVFDGVDAAHLFAVSADDVADPVACAEGVVRRATAAGVRQLTVLDGVGTVPLGPAVTAVGGTDIAPVEFMANALWWADAIRADGVVREPFASSSSTVVHEADIAAVIATVLTGNGHDGATLTVTGPEPLSVHDRVAVLADVLGRALRVDEPSHEEAIAQWRSWGLDEDTVAQFLRWAVDPPQASTTPSGTVERITGRAGRTFRQWASENVAAFR